MKRRGAGTITIEDVGSRVRLQAWVQRRRDLGGLLFLDSAGPQRRRPGGGAAR